MVWTVSCSRCVEAEERGNVYYLFRKSDNKSRRGWPRRICFNFHIWNDFLRSLHNFLTIRNSNPHLERRWKYSRRRWWGRIRRRIISSWNRGGIDLNWLRSFQGIIWRSHFLDNRDWWWRGFGRRYRRRRRKESRRRSSHRRDSDRRRIGGYYIWRSKRFRGFFRGFRAFL